MTAAADLKSHYRDVRARLGAAPVPALRRIASPSIAPAPVTVMIKQKPPAALPVPTVQSVVAEMYVLEKRLDVLRDVAGFEKYQRPVQVGSIIQLVCAHFGLTREQLLSSSKERPLAWPRHIALYLCCTTQTNLTGAEIARRVGRDYSTVFHSRNKVAHERGRRAVLETLLSSLESQLRNPVSEWPQIVNQQASVVAIRAGIDAHFGWNERIALYRSSRKRSWPVVVTIYFYSRLTKMSREEIAEKIGGHSLRSVHRALARMTMMRASNAHITTMLTALENIILRFDASFKDERKSLPQCLTTTLEKSLHQ